MSLCFEAVLSKVESFHVIKVPIHLSESLPSRGMVMISGTINEVPFIAPLEPDGKGSHWFEVIDTLMAETDLKIGQTVNLKIEPTKEWIEPVIPTDIMDELMKEDLILQWNSLTIKARWEWIRWIRSTENIATRQKRIHVACSKLQKGDRRPCCFDTTRCTIPEVSKSGVLLD